MIRRGMVIGLTAGTCCTFPLQMAPNPAVVTAGKQTFDHESDCKSPTHGRNIHEIWDFLNISRWNQCDDTGPWIITAQTPIDPFFGDISYCPPPLKMQGQVPLRSRIRVPKDPNTILPGFEGGHRALNAPLVIIHNNVRHAANQVICHGPGTHSQLPFIITFIFPQSFHTIRWKPCGNNGIFNVHTFVWSAFSWQRN